MFILVSLASAFSVSLHNQYTADAIHHVLGPDGLGLGAMGILEVAQRRTDAGECFEAAGDKSSGRYYLHHVWPDADYTPAAHRAVVSAARTSTESGPGVCQDVPRPASGAIRADLCDFVRVSESRVLEQLELVLHDSQWNPANAGQVVYALGVVFHEVQDYKHRQGNHGRPETRPIRSRQHFFGHGGQTCSDVDPPREMAAAAVTRSEEWIRRVRESLSAKGHPHWDTLLPAIRALPEAAANQDHRPKLSSSGLNFTMGYLFPVYAVEQSWMLDGWCPTRSDVVIGDGR